MTLHPHSISPVPEETARIAHAACPKGNPYLQMRDLLGTLYDDQLFAALFPPQGQPALARLAPSPGQHHAVCAIRLSDRQAAEAVRIRIDWKYALNLELSHPSYDFSVLCSWRARLLVGHAEQLLFETMLDQFKTHGLLKARWAPTHRFDPYPGRHSHPQPLGMRGRDDAPRARSSGSRGSCLAASAGPPRVEGAL